MSISFGIVTDIQHADLDPDPPNYFRASTQKLRTAIDTFNTHNLDFIVNLGDTIDRDLASFDSILPIFDSARAPVYHLLGNHDFAVSPDEKPFPPKLLNIPGPPYHRRFTLPGFRFLLLDGNHLSLAAHPPGSPAFQESTGHLRNLAASAAPNALPYNGGLGSGQLAWLDRQLSKADHAGERVIVFNHFPVLPDSTHNLWDADALLETLTNHQSPVAHLNGHRHAGGYAKCEGIHFLTLKALLETPDTATFCTVEIAEGLIAIEGHGNQPSYQLDY